MEASRAHPMTVCRVENACFPHGTLLPFGEQGHRFLARWQGSDWTGRRPAADSWVALGPFDPAASSAADKKQRALEATDARLS